MNGGDGTNMFEGTCAGCRYQRKRCDEGCQLARYFPESKRGDFLCVHRLYGVSNFLTILNAVPDDQRDKTAQTLIVEARIRSEYPVHGSLAIEASLRSQISACEKELEFVKKQVSAAKEMVEKQGKLVVPPVPYQFPSSGSQVAPLLDGYYVQALPAINPFPMGEDAHIKPSDVQPVGEHGLTNFLQAGESSSAAKARGKRPIVD